MSVSDLEHEDPKIRLRAISRLVEAGDRSALPSLVARLRPETHHKVLASLLVAVGKLGTKEQMGPLGEFIDHEEPRVRANVIEALIHLNTTSALPIILPLLADPNSRVRASAARALDRLGPTRVMDVLTKMMKSPHKWMRGSAVYAFALMPRDQAAPLVEAALGDPDETVRRRAGKVKALFEKKEALEPSGADQKIPEGIVPSSSAIPVRPKAKTRKTRSERGPRKASAPDPVERALEQGDSEELARILELRPVETDRFKRSRLMSAIGLIGDATYVPVLIRHLDDPDPRVVGNCVRSLTQLSDRSARGRVRPLLSSVNARLRTQAIHYFAATGDDGVESSLRGLIEAPDLQARIAGLHCLAELDRSDLLDLVDSLPPDPEGVPLAERLKSRWDKVPADTVPGAGAVLARLKSRSTRPRSALPTVPPPADEPGAPEPGDPGGVESAPAAEPETPIPADEIRVSARRWRALILAGRLMATLTDVLAIAVPLVLITAIMHRAGGGLPAIYYQAIALAGVLLVLARDTPGGPGIGKKILGLQIEVAPEAVPLGKIWRQIPVLLAPWGLAELWFAGAGGDGQRWSDRRLGLTVRGAGERRLDLLAVVWLGLGAALGGAGLVAFTPSTGGALGGADTLVTEVSTGGGPAGVDEPQPAASPGPIEPGERFAHAGMGVSIQLPRGFKVSSQSNTWMLIESDKAPAGMKGWAFLATPEPGEEEPADVGSWAEEMARECRRKLSKSQRKLMSWTRKASRFKLAGREGILEEGEVLGGGRLVVYTTEGLSSPLGFGVCIDGGGKNADFGILEMLATSTRPLAATAPAGKVKSQFLGIEIPLPAGWELHKEDAEQVVLRPSAEKGDVWIRLRKPPATTPLPSPLTSEALIEWWKKTQTPFWSYEGLEVSRSEGLGVKARPDLVGGIVHLRLEGQGAARFRGVWVPSKSLLMEEWMVDNVLTYGTSLDPLIPVMVPPAGDSTSVTTR